MERSWRPSCGYMIFRRFLVRFWGRFGRPRGWEMEPKLEPDGTQIEDGKEDAKRSAPTSSWGALGVVLERYRAILAEVEAILGRFGGGWEGQNHCFSLRFSILFDTSTIRTKFVILADLGAILGPLGTNLGPLGPNLDRFRRPRGPKRDAKRQPRGVQKESKMTPIFLSIFGSIWDRLWRPQGGESPRI